MRITRLAVLFATLIAGLLTSFTAISQTIRISTMTFPARRSGDGWFRQLALEGELSALRRATEQSALR